MSVIDENDQLPTVALQAHHLWGRLNRLVANCTESRIKSNVQSASQR